MGACFFSSSRFLCAAESSWDAKSYICAWHPLYIQSLLISGLWSRCAYARQRAAIQDGTTPTWNSLGCHTGLTASLTPPEPHTRCLAKAGAEKTRSAPAMGPYHNATLAGGHALIATLRLPSRRQPHRAWRRVVALCVMDGLFFTPRNGWPVLHTRGCSETLCAPPGSESKRHPPCLSTRTHPRRRGCTGTASRYPPFPSLSGRPSATGRRPPDLKAATARCGATCASAATAFVTHRMNHARPLAKKTSPRSMTESRRAAHTAKKRRR